MHIILINEIGTQFKIVCRGLKPFFSFFFSRHNHTVIKLSLCHTRGYGEQMCHSVKTSQISNPFLCKENLGEKDPEKTIVHLMLLTK